VSTDVFTESMKLQQTGVKCMRIASKFFYGATRIMSLRKRTVTVRHAWPSYGKHLQLAVDSAHRTIAQHQTLPRIRHITTARVLSTKLPVYVQKLHETQQAFVHGSVD